MKLGKLQEVDIRNIWAHEQHDFSKWLASESNINVLGETLGLSLTDIETEKFVGNYRCDILCKDEITGKNVLIENQLESTNHDHLGKIITYASGLDAAVIVWIVAEARQEHASAIEWLNLHTDESVSFFLIEIHVFRIGESDPAPQFQIIQQPNDFVKTVKSIANSKEMSKAESSRMEFWNQLNDYIDQHGKPFNKHKATKDHWYNVAVGSSQCYITIELVNKEHYVRVGLYIPDNKELYDTIHKNKEAFEKTVGFPIEWDRLDGKKAASIHACIPGLNFEKQANYPQLMEEIVKKTLAFREAAKLYIA